MLRSVIRFEGPGQGSPVRQRSGTGNICVVESCVAWRNNSIVSRIRLLNHQFSGTSCDRYLSIRISRICLMFPQFFDLSIFNLHSFRRVVSLCAMSTSKQSRFYEIEALKSQKEQDPPSRRFERQFQKHFFYTAVIAVLRAFFTLAISVLTGNLQAKLSVCFHFPPEELHRRAVPMRKAEFCEMRSNRFLPDHDPVSVLIHQQPCGRTEKYSQNRRVLGNVSRLRNEKTSRSYGKNKGP